MCQASGDWTDQVPTCEAVPCRALAPPGHATMNCSHPLRPTSFMSMCNFICLPGFMLNGSKVIECDSSGQWTAPEPICQAVSCLTLQDPTYGWMNCTHVHGKFLYNSTCNFYCSEGLLLKGSDSVLCQVSGDWTNQVPTCEAVPCRALAPPGHAIMNCSHPLKPSSFMSMCNFSCLPGFMLNGSKVIECDSSGQWTAPEPICQSVSCVTLQDPTFGWMNCTHVHGEFHYNSTCNFSCSGGFLLKGSDSVMCQASEVWTNQVPTCEAVPCRALAPPGHATMNCSHPLKPSSFMSMCNISCLPGFMLNGSKEIECDSSGQWTAPEPICQAVTCGAFQDPSNGWMNCSHVFGEFRYSSNCSFTCADGFVLNGSDSLLCQASEEWTDRVPKCAAVQCEALYDLSQGYISCIHPIGYFSFNSTCNYYCEEGFRLVGTSQIMCMDSGTWTAPKPNCEVITCSSLPSSHPRLMNCSHPNGNYSYGSECEYQCAEGFTLNGTRHVYCLSSGLWSDKAPECKALAFSFGKQLLWYTGGSLATILLAGTIITFLVKHFNRKRDTGLLSSSKNPVNTFENPAFENF
ncbi:P-selectin [Bombina bombina]|uniref:P-selectin n=1 Tax=Bombina bombina TaxID=8345 RepID=UPI00235A7829|nr:P-selectin [Bombina bombina]XP_053550067.1 P-selectin [Bombina bombina]